MGFSPKLFSICIIITSMALVTDLKLVQSASPDYTTLIYKGCARQKFLDPSGLYSQSLSAMFGSLVSQSTKTRFYKTTTGTTSQTTITGLFQCRGDLTNNDCYNCVSRLPVLSGKLCGKTIAARVQLSGCYLLYEIAGFAQISGMELLFKTCGKRNIAGTGIELTRDAAFGVMQNGVVSGHGFYATSYESVYVLGQCEGDIGDSDCNVCVKNAIEKAKVECGSSSSGQIYLHKCFIAYSYYPNGVPRRSSSSSNSGSSGTSSSGTTGRTVAIIVGGTAGVGFLIICLLFIKNLMKKKYDGNFSLLIYILLYVYNKYSLGFLMFDFLEILHRLRKQ